LWEAVKVKRKYDNVKPKLTEHNMSAEDLLIVNDMFSEDELTNAMKDDWSANQNKESLTELQEITKQAM